MRERPCKTHAWATRWPPSPLGPLVLWSPGPWLPGAWSPGPLVFCPLASGCFSQLVAYWIIGRAVWFCCTLDTSTNQPPPTIFQNHNGGAQSRGNNPIATNALPQPPSSFFNFCCNKLTWVSMVEHGRCTQHMQEFGCTSRSGCWFLSSFLGVFTLRLVPSKMNPQCCKYLAQWSSRLLQLPYNMTIKKVWAPKCYKCHTTSEFLFSNSKMLRIHYKIRVSLYCKYHVKL